MVTTKDQKKKNKKLGAAKTVYKDGTKDAQGTHKNKNPHTTQKPKINNHKLTPTDNHNNNNATNPTSREPQIINHKIRKKNHTKHKNIYFHKIDNSIRASVNRSDRDLLQIGRSSSERLQLKIYQEPIIE